MLKNSDMNKKSKLRLTKIRALGLEILYKGEDVYPYKWLNELSEDGLYHGSRSDKVVEEYVPYPDSVLNAEGEEILKEVKKFEDLIVKLTGWGVTQEGLTDKNGIEYATFTRPLRSEDVSRIYSVHAEKRINGISYDELEAQFTLKNEEDALEYNPTWGGYYAVKTKNKELRKLFEESGYQEEEYNWLLSGLKVAGHGAEVLGYGHSFGEKVIAYKIPIENYRNLANSSYVKITEYDKNKIGPNQNYQNYPIYEEEFIIMHDDVDKESYEKLRKYIEIEVEEY
jgi:hypothetical protein